MGSLVLKRSPSPGQVIRVAMPSNNHCCVPLCTNRRKTSPLLAFHSFPRSEELRKRWIIAIRRDEGPTFQVTGNTLVCSAHFLPSDYYDQYKVKDNSDSVDGEPVRKRKVSRYLLPTAVPSVFAFQRPTGSARPSPQERRECWEGRLQSTQAPVYGPLDEVSHLRKTLREKEDMINAMDMEIKRWKEEVRSLSSQLLRFANVKNDDEMLKYYTSFTREYWEVLWKYLQPSPENILSQQSVASEEAGRKISLGSGRKSKLPLEDELFMTLMRLRLGRLEQELAYQFGVSTSTISRIFTKWINYLYLRLGDIPLWPEWEQIEASMPSCFKESFPTTFAIVDATEIFCEVPSSLSLQSKVYSAYKSHTTYKGLVAIAPNGTFIFVSQLYTGSISDRELTKESGFLDFLSSVPKGKSIMADRGFDIQDLLAKYDILLNIPAFRTSATAHLKEADVVATQKIARVRIHVERAIGQVKKRYHILNGVIPLSLTGSINQIWSVCCLLANFSGPITSEPSTKD